MVSEMHLAKRLAVFGMAFAALGLTGGKPTAADRSLPKVEETPRNIIFILADDHRYDAMGFASLVLETPNLDRMAKGGSLVSQCVRDHLTLFAQPREHRHRAVRAQSQRGRQLQSAAEGTDFLPGIHAAGGLRHGVCRQMAHGRQHRPRAAGLQSLGELQGQGTYWSDGQGTSRKVPQNSYDGFNVNGWQVAQKGYITDELTDYALDWLRMLSGDRPFFLTLSHKAVHAVRSGGPAQGALQGQKAAAAERLTSPAKTFATNHAGSGISATAGTAWTSPTICRTST